MAQRSPPPPAGPTPICVRHRQSISADFGLWDN
jgi:hypothetical protein